MNTFLFVCVLIVTNLCLALYTWITLWEVARSIKCFNTAYEKVCGARVRDRQYYLLQTALAIIAVIRSLIYLPELLFYLVSQPKAFLTLCSPDLQDSQIVKSKITEKYIALLIANKKTK